MKASANGTPVLRWERLSRLRSSSSACGEGSGRGRATFLAARAGVSGVQGWRAGVPASQDGTTVGAGGAVVVHVSSLRSHLDNLYGYLYFDGACL